MSRKDYEAIARVFASERPGENWDANKRMMWDQLLLATARMLASDNSRFRRSQFIAAAGGTFKMLGE